MGKPSHNGRGTDYGSASLVVRLNTLNECKRRFGNVRKTTLETVIDRRLLGKINPERKTTVLLPFRRKGSSDLIELDEVERQVIQGGTELIECFPGDNRDINRGRFPHVRCFFALRISDDFVRLTASVSPAALLNDFDLLRYPEEFKSCRV
jgi:hypothetical protein